MIRCIAIDDEPLSLEIIQTFCKDIDFIHLLATFTNSQEASEYIDQHAIDLLFLDIQMPDINGLDFFREFGHDKMVVFTTAYSNYAHEGFDVHAIDYIVKPFNKNRFAFACQKALDWYLLKNKDGNNHTSFIRIKSDYKTLLLPYHEITYIESKDDYVRIYLDSGKFIMSKITTKAISEKLPSKSFLRIHRSYIVHRIHVKQVKSNSVIVAGNELPIGKNFKQIVKEMFKES